MNNVNVMIRRNVYLQISIYFTYLHYETLISFFYFTYVLHETFHLVHHFDHVDFIGENQLSESYEKLVKDINMSCYKKVHFLFDLLVYR